VLAGAAAAALFVSAPWKDSPGFLERAQAALAPPEEGSVLHYRYEETQISKDFGCTVTTGPNEIWIDQTPPHRYRALVSGPPPGDDDSRTLACRDRPTFEIGGALDTQETPLMIVPHLQFSPDPVAKLREAIRIGSAHDEGKTELDGRTVERIRIDRPPDCPDPCELQPSYAYVDPETFSFVQEEWPVGLTLVPGPGRSDLRFDVVVRYLTFEYLPRTAVNLAFTDIRAQHPGATGP